MITPGRKFSAGSTYRYGFNGKEKSNEIYGEGNAYDFGERIQDPRLVRFLSLDPLSKKFASESNYSYAGNNPIYYIDKDGKYKIAAEDLAGYRKSYPLLVKYLETQVKADVFKSQKIINAFNSIRSGNTNPNLVSNPDFLSTFVSWGSGATIKFVPNPGFPVAGANAKFTPGANVEGDLIEINSKFAAQIEKILKSKASDKTKQAAFMKFYTALLHETGHEVNTPDKVLRLVPKPDPHTYDGNPRNASELKYDMNTPGSSSGFEAGYKFEQSVWGTDCYRPSDNYDQQVNGPTRNVPGVMEDVIEHADGSELPTVPSNTNTTGNSNSSSTKGKTKKKS